MAPTKLLLSGGPGRGKSLAKPWGTRALRGAGHRRESLVAAMQQTADWLRKLGMSEYAQLFADNSIDDVSILRDLTDQDLKDVGVPLGHRRKILRAIGELDRPEVTAATAAAVPAS